MKIYNKIRPLIFKFDAENSHDLAINFLHYFPNLIALFCRVKNYPNLAQKIWDIDFSNPIGLAAGFDKNAQALDSLEKFGFGFLEAGTVTPKAQKGNNKKRIFRLIEDQAIINRLGFNNLGSDVFLKNISRKIAKNQLNFDNFPNNSAKTPIGINIGKNKDSEAISDYLFLLEKFYHLSSYITINISSPNTKNLRDLQDEKYLDEFLSAIIEKKNQLKNISKLNRPILLKIAPDLTIYQQEKIVEISLKNQIDGLIISNTTIDRNFNLQNSQQHEAGGLSGKPLFEKSNQVLKNFYKLSEGKIPLIGVGGISSIDDVYKKIKCGASLVQIYSAFIYQGFSIVEEIKSQLSKKIEKEGIKNISGLIGVDVFNKN
jgi:dihydroorotate dehydrogenase